MLIDTGKAKDVLDLGFQGSLVPFPHDTIVSIGETWSRLNVWLRGSTADWKTVFKQQLPMLNSQTGSDLGLGLVSAFISDFYMQHQCGRACKSVFVRNWRNLK